MRMTLCLASVLFLSGLAHAQTVWVASESTKVRPSDPIGPARAATLEAARNEFEAFHLVVHGGAAGVANVTVTAHDLAGPSGAVIGGAEIHVFREAWINLATPSNIAGATGRWPDAMIPAVDELFGETRNAFPTNVPASEQQPVYVEYHVPETAAAGVYTGTVHVAGNGLSVDVPVTLTVRGFTLPSTSSLRTAFGMGWSDACVAHFGSYAACGGDAGTTQMIQLYTRFALDHRITLDTSVYTGPGALPAGGYDWATWDATYGPLLDGTGPTRLKGAMLTSVRYVWDTASSDKYKEWGAHFKQRGWFDRTFDYTCDEPPAGCAWSDITSRAATVHGGDPDFHTLTTTTLGLATTNGVVAALDTLVPNLSLLAPMTSASTRASYDPWLVAAPHRQLWWYQSCMSHGCFIVGGQDTVGWPSYAIDAPALLNRAMEWMSYRNKMEGELYYDTTYALLKGDAWSNQYYFGGNGDGTLFYPGTPAKIGGTHDIPLASLRMKMIREGLEDYEYLKALADAGDPAMADAEAAKLAPTSTGFTADPAALDAARDRIATRIEQLSGTAPAAGAGGGSTPPAGGGTDPGAGGSTPGAPGGTDPGLPTQPTDATGSPTAKASGCSSVPGADARAPLSLFFLLALAGGLAARRVRARARVRR